MNAVTEAKAVIGPCSIVELHFEVRLEDGSIADSTYESKKPVRFKMGRGVFSQAFEDALMGLTPQSRKDILLFPLDAFGEHHPAQVYQMPLSRFKNIETLEEGQIFGFSQPDGSSRPGIIRAISENEATIDFNHPLSGLVVLFKVEILKVC